MPRKIPLLLILFTLFISSCGDLVYDNPNQGRPSNPQTSSSEWFQVYFSDPGGVNSQTQRGGPDTVLAEAIREAHASIDIAIYDLNLWSIRDALLEAHRNGVVVRLVVESDNLDSNEFQELIGVGIPVLGDRHEAFMHNKFIVIDRYQVWTGSMNMTLNGAYHNDNNLVRINSTQLAENYLVEFEEMFTEDLFGNESPSNTPNPRIQVNGTPIEVYFSPDDGAQSHIVELINNAQESIYFMAFAFTADPISLALLDAHDRGLIVSGVIERRQSNNMGSDYQPLVDAGLNIILDQNPKNMHHKVIIIDGQIVITGSYNFSRAAEERNDENVLIIFSDEIAEYYLNEFDKVFGTN